MFAQRPLAHWAPWLQGAESGSVPWTMARQLGSVSRRIERQLFAGAALQVGDAARGGARVVGAVGIGELAGEAAGEVRLGGADADAHRGKAGRALAAELQLGAEDLGELRGGVGLRESRSCCTRRRGGPARQVARGA